jgi:hypothetical protein
MKLVNKTKNFTIADDIQVLSSLPEKTKGLLGDKQPHAVFFKTRWGIHTFGMFFPIDVLVLDDDNCVREIKKNLTPNKFFFWNPSYKKIFELPCGLLGETKVGDSLLF